MAVLHGHAGHPVVGGDEEELLVEAAPLHHEAQLGGQLGRGGEHADGQRAAAAQRRLLAAGPVAQQVAARHAVDALPVGVQLPHGVDAHQARENPV